MAKYLSYKAKRSQSAKWYLDRMGHDAVESCYWDNQAELSFTRVNKNSVVVKLLKYILFNPLSTRKEIQKAVFGYSLPGNHCGYFQAMITTKLIAYDKKFRYYIAENAVPFLQKEGLI